ncbi:hypothetical protein M3J09_006405 [Ascochyta lentis]
MHEEFLRQPLRNPFFAAAPKNALLVAKRISVSMQLHVSNAPACQSLSALDCVVILVSAYHSALLYTVLSLPWIVTVISPCKRLQHTPGCSYDTRSRTQSGI